MRGLKGRSRQSVPLNEREISRTKNGTAGPGLEQENGSGRGSNFSAQEWELLTDHRETKTLGGKSMTQVRDTQNETKTTKKLMLLWLHQQAAGNKTRREKNSKLKTDFEVQIKKSSQ
jgi:hypothetical protein